MGTTEDGKNNIVADEMLKDSAGGKAEGVRFLFVVVMTQASNANYVIRYDGNILYLFTFLLILHFGNNCCMLLSKVEN